MVNLSDPSNERIHRRCSVLSLLIIKIASLSTYVLLSLSDFKTEVAKMMSAVSFSRIVHIYLSRPRLLILPMVSDYSTVSPKEIFNVAMFRFLSVPNYVEPLSMFSSSLNIQNTPSTSHGCGTLLLSGSMNIVALRAPISLLPLNTHIILPNTWTDDHCSVLSLSSNMLSQKPMFSMSLSSS